MSGSTEPAREYGSRLTTRQAWLNANAPGQPQRWREGEAFLEAFPATHQPSNPPPPSPLMREVEARVQVLGP